MFFEFAWPARGFPIALGMKTCLSRMVITCPEFPEKNIQNSLHTNDGLVEKPADRAIWANFSRTYFSFSMQKQHFSEKTQGILRHPWAVIIIA